MGFCRFGDELGGVSRPGGGEQPRTLTGELLNYRLCNLVPRAMIPPGKLVVFLRRGEGSGGGAGTVWPGKEENVLI